MAVERRHALWIVFLALLQSCASHLPPPIPATDRIKCVIQPLRDLTGDYEVMEPKMELLLTAKLKDDYAHRFEKAQYPTNFRTVVLTNTFCVIDNVSDSLRLDPLDFGSTLGADILVRGTVEQIRYGLPEDIEALVFDTWLFGFMGILAWDAAGRDNRTAFVEYRFEIYGYRDQKVLKTLLIQGACRSGVPDRESIVKRANIVAAESMAWELNKKIAGILGREPKEIILKGIEKEPYPTALRNL